MQTLVNNKKVDVKSVIIKVLMRETSEIVSFVQNLRNFRNKNSQCEFFLFAILKLSLSGQKLENIFFGYTGEHHSMHLS